MNYLSESNNTGIATLPVVPATMQDRKCFLPFVFKLRRSLWNDGAVFAATLQEGSDSFLPLSKAIKIKMRQQVILPSTFAS